VKIIDKNTKPWIGSEKEWAYKDKNGEWWLIKDTKKNKHNTMSSCINPIENLDKKKLDFLGGFFSKGNLCAIAFSFLLGISVALNLYQYMLLKSYADLLSK